MNAPLAQECTVLVALSLAACDGGSSSGDTDASSTSMADETSTSSDDPTPGTTSSSATTATTVASTTTDATTTEAPGSSSVTGEDTDSDSETGTTGGNEDDVPVVVAVGKSHARYVSLDDGITWCQVGRTEDPAGQDFDTPFLLRNVSYAGGRFIAGSWRAIFVSDNGLEWEDITGDGNPEFGQWVAQIQYGNGWWVATGGYGTAMRSEDLVTWEVTSEGMPGTEASRSLAFGNGMFVTGRDNVGWFSSDDGAQWTSMDPAGDSSLVFDGAQFVAHPGYDESPEGTRLRGGWPDGIERAVGEGAFERVATVGDNVTRFAFGFTSEASIASARVGPELDDCL